MKIRLVINCVTVTRHTLTVNLLKNKTIEHAAHPGSHEHSVVSAY